MDFIEGIRTEIWKITAYNISVMESPNGPEWVRIQTYPCVSVGDDDTATGDFKAEEIWSQFVHGRVHDETTLWHFLGEIMPPSPMMVRMEKSGKNWLQFMAEDA